MLAHKAQFPTRQNKKQRMQIREITGDQQNCCNPFSYDSGVLQYCQINKAVQTSLVTSPTVPLSQTEIYFCHLKHNSF